MGQARGKGRSRGYRGDKPTKAKQPPSGNSNPNQDRQPRRAKRERFRVTSPFGAVAPGHEPGGHFETASPADPPSGHADEPLTRRDPAKRSEGRQPPKRDKLHGSSTGCNDEI